MRKGPIVVAVIAVVLAAGWYWGSPYWTLRSMRAAAERGDAAALSAQVDFPALRENVKAEINRSIAAESARQSGGLSTLGAAFATAFVSPMVDAMITPQGVERMFQARTQPGTTGATSDEPVLPRLGKNDGGRIERDSFDQFRVVGDDRGAMLFRRDGLGWKLSGIDLPPR